ncbi:MULTISPECIES: hypothetical protein [unclassified Streptomyces]|uniref:hypothetical protein n=1 Tax=unclassified Streptomyces TaxID=2593676 RepID=UPI001654F5AB|nr:hypothetical protein [Streptomyces sp. CB02980]MCB8905045.1 hypothetical protein [Streptomyces sp. CB02980]
MKHISRVLAAGALVAAALAVTAPSASAGGSGALDCTVNFSISSGEGYANGKWCDYNTRISGNVHDTKSDGRCPFVRAYMSGGGWRDSDWAGPKGDSSPVNVSAPSGQSITSISMSYIRC